MKEQELPKFVYMLRKASAILHLGVNGGPDSEGISDVTVSTPHTKEEVSKLVEKLDAGIAVLERKVAGEKLDAKDKEILRGLAGSTQKINGVFTEISAEHMFSHGRKGDVYDDQSILRDVRDDAFDGLGTASGKLASLVSEQRANAGPDRSAGRRY